MLKCEQMREKRRGYQILAFAWFVSLADARFDLSLSFTQHSYAASRVSFLKTVAFIEYQLVKVGSYASIAGGSPLKPRPG